MPERVAPQPVAGRVLCANSTEEPGHGKCNDQVCIVGLACRLPNGIRSPQELWDFVIDKKPVQSPLPATRPKVCGFSHTDNPPSDEMGAGGGCLPLRGIPDLESSFSGVKNSEESATDRRQRQLLEVIYECLGNAGVPLKAIAGTDTGVFIGSSTMDLHTTQTRDPGHRLMDIAKTISHRLDLHGPSFTLDTASSSAMHCLHNAVRAVQSGECKGAIVAVADLVKVSKQHMGKLQDGVLAPASPHDTTHVSANDGGWAESFDAIHLKPLSIALNDGDKIWSILRGTAITADGETEGMAQPNAILQEAAMREAYSKADIDFLETDYVECHGTSTAVGDMTEVDTIASCFTPRHGFPLMLGSNDIPHSEATRNLTSLIKVSLAFENDCVPPNVGAKALDTELKLDEKDFIFVTDTQPWPRDVRRASINSVGYGGACSHAILESPRSYLGVSLQSNSKGVCAVPRTLVLPISATSKSSLESRVEQIRQVIGSSDGEYIRRLAFTLTQRRNSLRWKQHILLQAGQNGTFNVATHPKLETAESAADVPLPFAFIFTGQGAQYAGMAKELLDADNTFLATIRNLDQALKSLGQLRPEWTLEQSILDSPNISQVNHATRSQPLNTAIQIGLVKLLHTYGIRPSAVVGHSSGEIAAAYAAGLLTESQAIKVAYFRGYAADKVRSVGAMLAAGVGVEVALSFITEKGLDGKVCVACVNSPASVTLSGDPEGIDVLRAGLKSQGYFTQRLQTGGLAYHSPMMGEVGDLYEQLLEQHLGAIAVSPLTAKMFSTVGFAEESLRTFDDHLDTTAYWRENLESPVQFSGAVKNLVAQGKFHLLEVGPHSALKGAIQQIRAGLKLTVQGLPYNCTLVKKVDACLSIKNLAGNLFLNGHELDWLAINDLPRNGLTVLHELPIYP